jgi:hypothetical protein
MYVKERVPSTVLKTACTVADSMLCDPPPPHNWAIKKVSPMPHIWRSGETGYFSKSGYIPIGDRQSHRGCAANLDSRARAPEQTVKNGGKDTHTYS